MTYKNVPELVEKIPGGKIPYFIYRFFKDNVRKLFFYIQGGSRYNTSRFYNPDLSDAAGDCSPETDIFDHLGTIFFFAVDARPSLIVELGTRGGESTRALLAAASLSDAIVLSIDVEDCKQAEICFRERWHFIKADDIKFGRSEFTSWCAAHSVAPVIDVLFVDTSHEYSHTKNEIETWSNYLSEEGTIIFHDTNMGKGMYSRNNGSMGFGWNNQRGVIRAIEEFIGRRYDENSFFADVTDKFNIIHFPNSNGLTILKKSLGRNKDNC